VLWAVAGPFVRGTPGEWQALRVLKYRVGVWLSKIEGVRKQGDKGLWSFRRTPSGTRRPFSLLKFSDSPDACALSLWSLKRPRAQTPAAAMTPLKSSKRHTFRTLRGRDTKYSSVGWSMDDYSAASPKATTEATASVPNLTHRWHTKKVTNYSILVSRLPTIRQATRRSHRDLPEEPARIRQKVSGS
jgi:hypothetical protein